MTHHLNHCDRSALIMELIEALHDLDALDRLDHARLASIATLAEAQLGPVGDFGIACRSAWELARPPADEDLVHLSDWIDWDDDERNTAPPVDLNDVVEALAEEHAELLAEIRTIAERGQVAA